MKFKHWIKIIIFIGCAALLVWGSSILLCVANEKDSVGVYGFYKEPKDSLDIILIGPSTVYTAFYSPLAYDEQGLTSYSISTSTMPASLYRYATEIALQDQHPQLLIYDTWGFCEEDQYNETSLRKFLDALPNSEIKERAIRELVPEELQSSFFYPFQKYHSSWERLGELVQVLRDKLDMNRQGYSITKNFATTPYQQPYGKPQGTYAPTEEGLVYLQELLDYLKETGIEHVLFIRSPEMAPFESADSYHTMIDMIREDGYDFLNMNAAAQDMGLDPGQDFYNFTHLNIFGVEKFTSFLAEHVLNRYQLKTEHTDEVVSEWKNCASFNEEIISRLETLTVDGAQGFLYTQRDFLNWR